MKTQINMLSTARFVLFLAMIVISGLCVHAQSTDFDSPTVMTAPVIEGEDDGSGETVYYQFTALKGDVKVTVDAKTDNYSSPLRVTLLNTDGKELLPIYVVAKDSGQRETAVKHFVREQTVIVRITTQKDEHVKLLAYKIKLEGSVKVETPPAADTPQTAQASAETPMPPQETQATESAAASADPSTPQPKLKDKMKAKAKDAAKKAIEKIID